MLILPLLPLLSPIVTTAKPLAPSTRAVPNHCPQTELQHTTATRPEGSHTLGDQPPANLYLAVDRHVGGCRAPLIIRTGIGKR